MIGKAAGIDHPLVNYYFPTKAVLFEEVIKQVTDEYYQADLSWFDGLDKLAPRLGLICTWTAFLILPQLKELIHGINKKQTRSYAISP